MGVKAKESPQIVKARKKLQRHLEESEQQVNPDALKSMRHLIERQLARHQTERIDLKSKQVTLFDENKHPAKTESRFVAKLMRQLKTPPVAPKSKKLEGRVRAISEDEQS